MAKVCRDMNMKQKKKLAMYSEAANTEFGKMEEDALCKALQDCLARTTDTLQQQNLEDVVRGLKEEDFDKLVQ